MHIEWLAVETVRCLGSREFEFTAGAGRPRKWNLLPAGCPAWMRLRLLALAELGQQQTQ